jgi:hypothetical protein
MHDPSSEREAAEARRLGGVRRRREKATALAFDLEGTEGPDRMRRVLEIATQDTLLLENGIARNRTLLQGVRTDIELYKLGEIESRLRTLELLALGYRPPATVNADPPPHDEPLDES